MSQRHLKFGYFTLEGFNSFATTFYFYYFYFFMGKEYGLGNRANLGLAALSGACYAFFAWSGGRFAQRFGYFTALKLGFFVMMVSLTAGLALDSVLGHVLVMAGTVAGVCFTWPALEALVSEGETRAGIQRMVGVYNIVWAGTGALAYFTGGAMLEKLGRQSLFYVPLAFQVCQFALTLWLEAQARRERPRKAGALSAGSSAEADADAPSSRAAGAAAPLAGPAVVLVAPAMATAEARSQSKNKTESFLRMAWLSNPFAYVAINTLVAVFPGVARRLELSTMMAGFCCSAWCFARFGAFVGLWVWTGWHYRFRWLLAAYLTLVGAFAALLLVPNLIVLVAAQIFFGAALGLIYYSSLFYSMDLSDTKGEHGGIHEAAIGLGNCAGPAVGAASLYLLPQYANSGALAVSGLLVLGFFGLLTIWRRGVQEERRAGRRA
jgi:predicted MFS family arabinose efflux permease